jgi:peptide/nickel transport system substrate-binding protein
MKKQKRQYLTRRLLNQISLRISSFALLCGILALAGSPNSAKAGSLSERRIPTQYFMTNPEGYSAPMWEIVGLQMDIWEKELGVEFEREVVDHDQLIAKGHFQGKFDVRIQYWSGIPSRLEAGFLLASKFFATCENFYPRIPKEECPGGGGPFNSTGYYNREFNKLIENQRQEFEYRERKKIIDNAIEMIVEANPEIVLFSPYQLHLMNTKNWGDEKPMVGEGLASFWNSVGIKPKAKDKTLRIGSTYAVPTLNPMAVMTGQGYRPLALIYDRLMRIDRTGKPVNWMVEQVEICEGNAGPKTAVNLKLREDLRFHDGTAVTADDVKFTFDFAKKHKAVDLVRYLNRVESVEKLGKYSVRINLTDTSSEIYHVLLARAVILPKHIWEKVPDEVSNPVEWANPSPIGSGPFKFLSWERGSQLVLAKNENYFQPAEPDRLVRVRFETLELLAASIERGEIDIQWGEPMQAQIGFRAEKKDNVKLVRAQNHGHMTYQIRMAKKPYSDPVFRKALEYCVPREKIIKEIYLGLAEFAVSPVPPGNEAWHNPKVFEIAGEYNPEKARQILKQAGYDWDSDGRLCYPD